MIFASRNIDVYGCVCKKLVEYVSRDWLITPCKELYACRSKESKQITNDLAQSMRNFLLFYSHIKLI